MAFLADDLLEGRGTGTRGYQLAANYVRAQFEEMGLKPAGVNGTYFQNVRFRKIELLQDKSSLTLKHNGTTRTLVSRQGLRDGRRPAFHATPRSKARSSSWAIGVSAPEFGYDDYAGIDVRGKIVAALYGAPSKLPSAPGAHFSSSEQKAAHGRGARSDRIPYHLGWQGRTAHSVFRIRAFFKGAGAALAG